MIWVFYLLFCWACVFYWDDHIGWNVRYAMKWNCRKPKNRSKSLLFYSCYFFGACCRALPAGLFTHFKFWACFHQHTGWKTFAPPLERSQMWWKIQVADIHLMHYAFHVLSRVTVGRVWHYWNNKRKKKSWHKHPWREIYTFELEVSRYGRKNYKSCSNYVCECSSAIRPAPDRRETPQLVAIQRLRAVKSCPLAQFKYNVSYQKTG